MRNAFVKGICDLARKDKRIFLLTGDLGFHVLEEFRDEFPNRFLNVGVAEANLLTIAAGLATTGYIPFVYSIATFITMRAFEQIRNDVALQNLNVKIVGVGGGLAYGKAGPTHHSLEDIGLMRLIGNMTILNPCEPQEVEQLVPQIVNKAGPVYIRLEKNPEKAIHNTQMTYTLGKGEKIKNGKSVAILTTGAKLSFGIEIVKRCERENVFPSLYAFPTIAPLDKRLLQAIMRNHSLVTTIEEHSIHGGFGSAVLEYIASNNDTVSVMRFGLIPEFSTISSSYEVLLSNYGFTPQKIAKELLKKINLNKRTGTSL